MLDHEWLKLILQAKGLGLTIEEIREFLYKEQKNIKIKK
ncbi:MAG TPA: DNA-binding anti-repressor SinI [Bacillus bacterium]|nr:DNA-binding anti-repressor SinI [Bacillus sp. (in: firmicutes)]